MSKHTHLIPSMCIKPCFLPPRSRDFNVRGAPLLTMAGSPIHGHHKYNKTLENNIPTGRSWLRVVFIVTLERRRRNCLGCFWSECGAGAIFRGVLSQNRRRRRRKIFGVTYHYAKFCQSASCGYQNTILFPVTLISHKKIPVPSF